MARDVLSEIDAWKNRLNRKGPFYLYKTEKFDHTKYDHSVSPFRTYLVPANHYYVIWNDKNKTKYGVFSDYMLTRYGVATLTVLNGDTIFDLWQGDRIDDEIFAEMVKVRNDQSSLPHFNLNDIQHLST